MDVEQEAMMIKSFDHPGMSFSVNILFSYAGW